MANIKPEDSMDMMEMDLGDALGCDCPYHRGTLTEYVSVLSTLSDRMVKLEEHVPKDPATGIIDMKTVSYARSQAWQRDYALWSTIITGLRDITPGLTTTLEQMERMAKAFGLEINEPEPEPPAKPDSKPKTPKDN